MKIAIASDHAGYRYKKEITAHVIDLGHEVQDFGTDSEEPVDYPLFICPAAEAVARGECQLGIIFGGSGNGEAIVANKVAGIRCAVVWNEASARYAREHNNANMISFGERMVTLSMAQSAVSTWLRAQFAGGRHGRRVQQIADVEASWCKE